MQTLQEAIPKDHIWWQSKAFYKYDYTKSLYEQINDIVNEKLQWYEKLLSWDEFYKYDNWKDLSLSNKYAAITTDVNPRLEYVIKTAYDEEQTFNRIVWHIPYFIWRDPVTGEEKEIQNQDAAVEEIEECLCRRIVPCHVSTWDENSKFEYSGLYTYAYNFAVNINDELTYVNVSNGKFDMSTTYATYTCNQFHYNDCYLYTANVYCNADTITDISFAFANDKILRKADLSECNISYATTMEGLFYGDSNLSSVNLSNLNLDTTDPTTDNMFSGCNKLKEVIVKNCSTSTIDQLKCILISCDVDISDITFVKK